MPPNTTATVFLPATDKASVKAGGRSAWSVAGIKVPANGGPCRSLRTRFRQLRGHFLTPLNAMTTHSALLLLVFGAAASGGLLQAAQVVQSPLPVRQYPPGRSPPRYRLNATDQGRVLARGKWDRASETSWAPARRLSFNTAEPTTCIMMAPAPPAGSPAWRQAKTSSNGPNMGRQLTWASRGITTPARPVRRGSISMARPGTCSMSARSIPHRHPTGSPPVPT